MITLIDVSIAYARGPGVFDITFYVAPGELVFLVGPSGAGKSTILKLINLELLPQQGEVEVNGFLTHRTRRRQIPYLRRSIGLVFQDFRLLQDRNAYDNIALPLHIIGMKRREIRERVYSVLEDVGLNERAHHYPRELSGGEQQRVAIARALSNEPDLILADEPTGNLPTDMGEGVMQTLEDLNRQGVTILMVTHNDELGRRAHRRVHIQDGHLLDGDSPADVERKEA